jgi:predicted metalloprotease
MIRLALIRGSVTALAATLVFYSPGAHQPLPVSAHHYTSAAATSETEVTSRDIAISNEKIRMAHSALTAMWTSDFRAIGERFAAPDLIPFLGGIRSACGLMRSNNALYCPRDNTIYFDEIFVAAQAKTAAQALGTDGDMAAVGIVAHEMGHAVAMQLGHVSRDSYENESMADCLAGAFTAYSNREGTLEDGDLDEAFYAISRAGDPQPELTGDTRTDSWILTRLARRAHGTKEQRMENFRRGLDGGAGACLPEFRGLK